MSTAEMPCSLRALRSSGSNSSIRATDAASPALTDANKSAALLTILSQQGLCLDTSETTSFARDSGKGLAVSANAVRAAESGPQSVRSSGWITRQQILKSPLSTRAVFAHRVFD